jgi:hypothetical protein
MDLDGILRQFGSFVGADFVLQLDAETSLSIGNINTIAEALAVFDLL